MVVISKRPPVIRPAPAVYPAGPQVRHPPATQLRPVLHPRTTMAARPAPALIPLHSLTADRRLSLGEPGVPK